MGSGDGSNLHDVSCTCWRHVRVIRDPRVTCGRTDQLLMPLCVADEMDINTYC